MGLRRQRKTDIVVHEPATVESLVASAARIRKLDGLAWRTYNFGDDSWQQEAWRLYDIIGELRFVANWVGSACSRVRIYVAEVDKNGRVQKEVEKPKVAGLADSLFGSASAKAEALRLMGINLTVAGDCYIVGRGVDGAESDEWYVVSCSELKRWGSNAWMLYPDGSKEPLDLDKDIVIRVWTPHPRRSLWADSPTRAAMPMLWEIERLTRYVFAQIDSRLVSAGLLPIPKETSFPDEDENLPGAESLTNRLLKTGSSSLKGEGTAAGVVPTIVEMPMEALGKIELVGFASDLSKQAMDLRAEAIRRFALAMDVAQEILTGTGDANHWSAWHVSAENVKVHIEPMMTRICDALTTAYLTPALKAVKEDPDKYIFWYDTAPLVVRPERLKDTLNLNEKGIVSDETVLIEGDYKLSDKPSIEEDLRKFTRTLMERDPNLFQIPAVRKIAGYTDDILPPDTVVTPQVPGQPGMPGAGPPPPPPPPTGIQPTGPAPIPQNSSAASTPGGPGALNNSTRAPALTASAGGDQALFAVANMAVLRALEVAGKRLVGNHHRVMTDTPAYDLHTRVLVSGDDQATRLLSGAWDQMSVLSEHLEMPELSNPVLAGTLQRYCATLLVKQHPHEAGLLWEMLSRQGFLDGES
jgi:hypothetical protein